MNIVFTPKGKAKRQAGVSLITIDDANSASGKKATATYEVILSATLGSLMSDGVVGTTVTFNGTLSQINSWLATLVYQPAADFVGTDVLNVMVVDAGSPANPDDTALSVADITIHVGDVNAIPVISLPAEPETSVGKGIDFNPKKEDVAPITVSDPDGTTDSQYELHLSVDHGKLTIGQNTGAVITIAGKLSDINAALVRLKYQPDAGFTGADTLHIVVNDGR